MYFHWYQANACSFDISSIFNCHQDKRGERRSCWVCNPHEITWSEEIWHRASRLASRQLLCLGAVASGETRLSAWKQWHQLGPDFGSLCKGNHWGRGSSMWHEFSFSVFGFIVWYLFCCLGSLRSVSSSGCVFFFFNRADRKDIWSLHQIFIPSKGKLIKVFSVKKDDQSSSVLYHLLCHFGCMWMREGLEWLSSHSQVSHPAFNLHDYCSLVKYIKAFGFVMKSLIENVHSQTAYTEDLRE